MNQSTGGSALRPFLIVVGFLGVLGIWAVYALRLNYPPIRSDGLGYYLYLPATLLYHDLGMHGIAEFFRSNQLPELAGPQLWHDSGPLLWQATGDYLVKYPLGEALLMLPFFLLACLLALATGTPLDGFSPVFQYVAAGAGLAYALAGIAALWKVLERHFDRRTVLLSLVGMVFGTNLFHYATYDSLFSHVYSFFLFSLLLRLIPGLYRQGRLRSFLALGALAGLIVVTRPTNILWLIFPVLYGVDSGEALAARLAFLGRHAGRLAGAALLAAAVVALQLGYWKSVTGQWVVFSYQGERFYFLQPEIMNVLFSVRKGLFFWSPLLLTVFPGLIMVRRRAPEYLVPMLCFLPLNVWVISSWHSWFYGGSFGHRAFIESLPLFAVCWCALYEGARAAAARWGILVFSACCVVFTTWNMVRYWTGVIPFDQTTWEYFAATFWNLTR